jgi:hypothetical protein
MRIEFVKILKQRKMRKNVISFIAVIITMTMTAFAQIPNPGFEGWTSGDPDGWASSNVFQAGLINITQSADYHSGSSAVKGEVVNFFGTPMGPVIQNGPGATGSPISEQYHSIELYYKFMPQGGDRFAVNVGLEKAGNPIAQGAVALPQQVNSYTHLTVPLTYTTSEVPDRALIQISINGPVVGTDLHVGSVMIVDDLTFSLSTGIENNSSPELNSDCFPNPASHFINIPVPDELSANVVFKVFDPFGKELKKESIQPQPFGKMVIQCSVEDLPIGIYFYSISGTNKQYRGKFTVSR